MSLPPSNGQTVLVTGISGYIASSLGLHILSAGYNLRGTTRSKANAAGLLSGAYAIYSSRVEVIEVPDLTISGAFDEAVRGVIAVCHAASPTHFSLQSWDEWVTPAVKGCVGILDSASAHAGSQLESVIFLSSVIVSTDPRRLQKKGPTGNHHFGLAEAQRQGLKPQAVAARLYQDSKTMAESAVWQWKDQAQPVFSICTVCPGVVTGPSVHPPATASALGSSLRPVWELFSGNAKEIPPSVGFNEYVDVRDVAKINLWCIEHPDRVDQQRYIVAAGIGTPQAVADILRKAYPERESIIPRGKPGQGYRMDFSFFNSNRKHHGTEAAEVMAIEYITYDRSIEDTAKVLEQYL